MEIWLWAVICIPMLIIAALIVKVYLLKKSANEIETAFAERLITETNTLIDISSGDRHMRSLANSINRQLRELRNERHRFQQGDTELKNAVTNISHDLRTPLTAIFGYIDLLEKQEKSAETERYINIIKDRCEMLMQLTEELFRYSVIITTDEEFKTEKIIVNHVLEESVAGYYATLVEHNITPDISIPEEKIICTANCSALSRIFSNLLNNAIKYSSGNLSITLTESGEIIFSNTAKGLDKVQISKLFDRFYTVETAHNSTGLGLAISRTLIEQMGGTIYAEYENSTLSIHIKLPPYQPNV